MGSIRILYHLLIISMLVFIVTILCITIYTSDGDNRIVTIYDNMMGAELEYECN